MAVVQAVNVKTPHDGPVEMWEWADMANGDTGTFVILPRHGDKSVHAYGTFGAGGTVTFRGSNETPATEANASIVHSPSETNLTLTATAGAGLKQVLEAPYSVSPKVTAGDGTTSLTVLLCVRR